MKDKQPQDATVADTRKARLAEALRANLTRRKEQARSRKAASRAGPASQASDGMPSSRDDGES